MTLRYGPPEDIGNGMVLNSIIFLILKRRLVEARRNGSMEAVEEAKMMDATNTRKL